MFCSVQGCENPAEFAFIWPWGEQAVCCGVHRLTLDQKCYQELKRGHLHFTVLNPNKVEEVKTHERVQFHARILTAEEETKQARRTVSDLQKMNAELVDQVRGLRAQKQRLEDELAEVRKEYAQACRDRDQAREDAGEAIGERNRLETLLHAAAGAAPPPHS